ncbi:MAG: SDR family oxidoreductase [Actinomycetia bacterium]|nr:SDR family oxidoreductase [Actinomycetes bacterium]MCP4222143.1 SDR family oxidoreductase [Actinomycetes bacterium]MCP5030790.1 SDR family oxidoreductase [Actinomycetes bacterium]
MASTTREGTAPVAVVTGGGTGVGRSAALALAAEGWALILAGRRLEALEETLGLAAAAGMDPELGLGVVADVGRETDVLALFDQVEKVHGRVDLLFNNAGTGAPPKAFDELSLADWQRVVDVNLTGSFLCARQAMALMKRQSPTGGRIINNGSISAETPRPRSAPYTATKHAITGLTKSLALDGRSHRIACGQIDIGNAETPMTEPMAAGVPQPDGSIRVEPRMDVDDVGRAISYMANLPLDSNVLFMTVMATEMPFVGRG